MNEGKKYCLILIFIIIVTFLFDFSNSIYGSDNGIEMSYGSVPTTGKVHSLVIFAAFKDDQQSFIPNWVNDIFNPNIYNSLQHYFNVQSNGLHTIDGIVLKKWYYSDQMSDCNVERYEFINDILEKVDEDIDFALFDNWTDSRIEKPDGKVDMIFFVIANSPWVSRASLEFKQYPFCYETNDTSHAGVVRIHQNSGATQRYQKSFERMIAIMAHEYGHMLGLPDLYDLTYFDVNPNLDDYSAGIGKWCLMSEGYGVNGLYSMCAFSRAKLGWIPVKKVNTNSYNIKVSANELIKLKSNPINDKEYFVLSYRNHSNYYDKKLPSGMLIWHVDEKQKGVWNRNENHKFIDLECADGLFSDKGFPGNRPDPIHGKDNLDYWAKYYPNYCSEKNGNLYDQTDVYDGVNYKSFTPYSNPNSNYYDEYGQNDVSHIAVVNIEPDGTCDVIMNYWAGRLNKDEYWHCECNQPYYLASDIVVPKGVTLTIMRDAEIETNGFSIISDGGMIIWDGTIVSVDRRFVENSEYQLFQNYPNPFNATTTIAYNIKIPATITLTVYNLKGHTVDRIIQQNMQPGKHRIHWNVENNGRNNIASGVYIYRLDFEFNNLVKKSLYKRMIYIK